MLKFQPGEVVHVVRKGYVLSRKVFDAFTYFEGTTIYHLEGHGEDFKESDLHATFENAMAELRKQAP